MKINVRASISIFNRLPLGQKLFVFYVLFIIVPVISIGIFAYAITKNMLVHKTQLYLQSKVEGNMGAIDNEFAKYAKSLTTLVFNKSLDDIFTYKYDTIGAESHTSVFRLRTLIFDVLGTDLENNVVQFYTNNTSIVDGSYVLGFDELKYKLSEDQLWQLEQSRILYFVHDIKNRGRTDRYIAIASRKYDLPYLEQCVVLINVPIHKVDAYLDISNISAGGWSGFGELADNSLDLPYVWHTQWNAEEKPADLQAIDANNRDSGSLFTEQNLIIYRKSNVAHFVMMSALPAREVYSDANNILAVTLLGIAIFTLILIPISYVVSRYLTRRFYQFIYNLEFRGQDSAELIMDNGQDEISRIIHKFNQVVIKNRTLLQERYDHELQLRAFETELLKAKLNSQRIELNLLQVQVDPHFLYNIFSSLKIALHANVDPERIGAGLDSVVKFYRLSLNNGSTFVTARQEIEIIREYLRILDFIYQLPIELMIEQDDGMEEIWCIKFLLQPIVENAVYHGLRSHGGNRVLMVSCERHGDDIVFTVSDNGAGFDPGQQPERGGRQGGFGLKNVRERIALFYGDRGRLIVASAIGQGTNVQIIIPAMSGEEVQKLHNTV